MLHKKVELVCQKHLREGKPLDALNQAYGAIVAKLQQLLWLRLHL
jgi:hypothetical protein